MKTLCTIFSAAGEKSIVTGGDDMLLRPGSDFYVPSFAKHLSCVPQLTVKICKLGKCIEERFASRYYEEMAAGVIFHADSLEEKLASQGIPAVQAFTFEGAAAIGVMTPFCASAELSMKLNGENIFSQNIADMPLTPQECLSEASQYHLLKTGDLLFCGNNLRIPLKCGDIIELHLGESSLSCKIV